MESDSELEAAAKLIPALLPLHLKVSQDKSSDNYTAVDKRTGILLFYFFIIGAYLQPTGWTS